LVDKTKHFVWSKMKTIAWKRSRVVKLSAIGGTLLICLILFIRAGDHGPGAPTWGIKSALVAKKAPWYTADKLGNFEPEEEPVGDGPGEGGKPYRLPADKQNDVDESIGNYGMNMAVSDAISLERAIPDTRQDE